MYLPHLVMEWNKHSNSIFIAQGDMLKAFLHERIQLFHLSVFGSEENGAAENPGDKRPA